MGCRKLTYLSAQRQKKTTENTGLKVVYRAENIAQRFNGVDPLAVMRHQVSTYNYVQNNPISRIDPNGALDSFYSGRGNTSMASGGSWANDVASVETNYQMMQSSSFDRRYGTKSAMEQKIFVTKSLAETSSWAWNKYSGTAVKSEYNPETRTATTTYSGAWVEIGGRNNNNSAQQHNGGNFSSRAGTALTVGGGLLGAAQNTVVNGDNWLGKNGKYYSINRANGATGSRSGAFKAASRYKIAGRVNVAATVALGGVNIYNGYQQDGGQFGINSQRATASTAGGIVGGWAGAEAGAAIGAGIGVWFGGVGAIPGAIIGGFVGGIAGSFAGSAIGEGSVNYYHKP